MKICPECEDLLGEEVEMVVETREVVYKFDESQLEDVAICPRCKTEVVLTEDDFEGEESELIF